MEQKSHASSHPVVPLEQSIIKNKFLRYIVPPSLLAFLTTLFYWPSLTYPFQFDDIANISKKYAIRFDNPLNRWLTNGRWFGDWLNSLNYQIGRFDPFSYRAINLTIHILAGITVFYLLLTICNMLTKRSFFKQNAFWIAFLSAALFLLHPVQTQTVTYVIQARLEGLATLFVLLTLLFYSLAVRARTALSRVGLIGVTLVLALIACGTKEIVIVMPFLILLLEWFVVAQQEWKVFVKRMWVPALFAVVFGALIVHFVDPTTIKKGLTFSFVTGNNRGNILTSHPLDPITPFNYLISQFRVVLHYFTLFFWPFNMSVEYDWKLSQSLWSFNVLFPLVMLMVMVGAALRAMIQKRALAYSFGLFWFLICVAPRSSIIPSPELVCDYKTYLASVGVYFMISTIGVYLLHAVWAALQKPLELYRYREMQLGLLTLVFLGFGFSTLQRNKVWESSVSFWEDNVKKAPAKARVHNNLGVALCEAGRVDESIISYKRAIELDSFYADPHSNIAVSYSMKNDVDNAIDALRQAIKISPNYPEAYNNLGTLLIQKKLYGEAEHALNLAIQLRPYYGKAFYNLARMYEEKGDNQLALTFLKKAVQGDLDIPEVYMRYGQMCMKLEKFDEAASAFAHCARLGGENEHVIFNYANALYMDKKHQQAEAFYAKLVRMNPADPRYMYNLAEAQFVQRNYQGAFESFKKITTMPQSIAQAYIRMANCLERLDKVNDAKGLLGKLLAANAAPDFKKAVSAELARLDLQSKVKNGNQVKLDDLKLALAQAKGSGKTLKINVAQKA